MCLIVFSLLEHPEYPLIFAGNRDEFHGRPTAAAHFWSEHPDLLAGRDLQAGGTWLGVRRSGRFATVTNYREPGEHRPDARSRGELVTNFLLEAPSARRFARSLESEGQAYNGFNLIFGGPDALFYVSNRGEKARRLQPGVYGLSNGSLDTPWPKVRRAKALFAEVTGEGDVDPEALLEVLSDDWRPPDSELPATGLGRRWERQASSIFIAGDEYGTRASTVLLVRKDGTTTFVERSFGPGGTEIGTEAFEFTIESDALPDRKK